MLSLCFVLLTDGKHKVKNLWFYLAHLGIELRIGTLYLYSRYEPGSSPTILEGGQGIACGG